MKKLLLLVLVDLVLLSCTQDKDFELENQKVAKENRVSRLTTGEKVKLIKAKDSRSYVCRYGTCASYQLREYVVEVENVAYNKRVAIHQELPNGQWEDIPLVYSNTTSTGTEIWKTLTVKTVFGNNPSPTTAYGEEIAVKYEVDGQTFWDNNYGDNYFIANYNRHSSSSFLVLDDQYTISQASASFYSYATTCFVSVIADIRNLAYAKEVKIVYSTDNWITTGEYNLSFDASNYVVNDSTGFERWSASFSIPIANKISYALSYKVNGQTYWDNNFGENYTLIYPTN